MSDDASWQAVIAARAADQPAVALARVRRLLAAEPAHWAGRLVLGRLLAELGRYADAAAALAALAEDPASEAPRARRLLIEAVGDLHARAGEVEPALRAYARLRELAPSSADGYLAAGAVLARAGRLDDADAMYRAGTACTEGAVDACWHNLGLVLRAQERPADAAVAFAAALAIDPAYRAARAALADVTAAVAETAAPPSPAAAS